MRISYFFEILQKVILSCIMVASPLYIKATTDDEKIDSLVALSEQFAKIDSFTKALYYLCNVMDMYEYRGDWDNYNKTASIVLDYAKRSGSKANLAEFYNKLGISSCLNGKNNAAIDYFTKALEINTELGKEQWMSNSMENIGLVYKDMGEYEKAIEFQMNSLKIREAIGHPRLAETYSNISQLFEYTGDYGKQLDYLTKAMKESEKYPNKHDLQAIICCEMGEYLLDKNESDSSIAYFKKGLEHSKQIKWNKGIAVFYGDLAEAYYSKGDIDQSIEMHQKSLDLSIKLNDCFSICQEYNSLSKLFLEKHQLAKASKMNQKAIRQSKECNVTYELLIAYKYASQISEHLGKYTDALLSYKHYHTLNDSLLNIDKQEKILEMETRYQTEKKEQQIDLLTTENQLKNQRLTIGTVLLIILVIVIILILYILQIRKKQAKLIQTDLQQKVLRSQMNPHFIFNILGSIQNFMLGNDTKKAAYYLSQFASLTRATLEYSASESISLCDEISMLTNYMELEKMRKPGRFNYQINTDDNLETDFIQIPPMMIQPFIENAIKHGFSDINYPGLLTIRISDKTQGIEFIIEDNGKGIDKSKKTNHRSLAMEIFEKRRKLIQQKHKKEFKFEVINLNDIDPTKTGVRILINVPVLDYD